MKYNVVGAFENAVKTFDTERVPVIYDLDTKGGAKHSFSQRELLNDIDLAWNSLYKDGKKDKDNKRKLFLNIVRFYLEVAVKNTDVDIKNFVFTPVDYSTENKWAVWFFKRQFGTFVKDSGYGKVINDLNWSLRKYGSCVSKGVGEDILSVPLHSLKLDQKAQTLMEGIEGGTPLIEEHEYSHYQMSQFPDWKGVEEFQGKRKVWEGYTLLSKEEYAEIKGEEYEEEDDDKKSLYLVIVMPSGKMEEDKRAKYDGRVLYCEPVDKIPYEECHTGKQRHRWLGMGEVEKQMENQIGKNLSTNLRVRGMTWSAKNVYQKAGEPIGRSLLTEVEDGEVLEVGLNGQISRIDTATRSLADFQQHEASFDDNSQKQSFAFESATGESFASGTPFRMGAMLSNSVMSHFDLERETFAFFLKDSFFGQILPIFKERAGKDLFIIGQTDEGFNDLLELYTEVQSNDYYGKLMTSPEILDMENLPTPEDVKQYVSFKLSKEKHLFASVPKEVYKGAKYKIDLDITGEDKDPADKETLTTLYQTMSQKGDPRADKVLDVLLLSMGKNMQVMAGKQMNPEAVQPTTNPDLAGLVPQQ